MIRVNTGSSYIFRFDDVLSSYFCQVLCDYAIKNAERIKTIKDFEYPGVSESMPWHDGDTFAYTYWDDKILKNQVQAYRTLLTQIIHDCYGEYVYPQFTDLVYWREGKCHPEHKDDGYEGEGNNLVHRHYTTVTYLNDDFEGGETFVKNEFGAYFTSVPKKGSVVIYPSDERASHGVNKVISGHRITLPTWFTKDINQCLGQ